MFRHVWSVICTQSIVDQETNNVSLISVLERISLAPRAPVPEKRPVIALRFELATLWSREEPDKPAHGFSRILVKTPSGEVVDTTEIEVDLTKYHRVRNRHRFVGFPLAGEGIYWFSVQERGGPSEDWKEVASIPLEIVVAAPEQK